MPHITVYALKQPDINKKRQLVEKLTDAAVEVYGVPKEAVTVEILENEPENVAHGGQLILDRDS
jgi:4-oxalocrotonate tautomerase